MKKEKNEKKKEVIWMIQRSDELSENIKILETIEEMHRMKKIKFLTGMKWLILVLKYTLMPKFTE